MRWEELVAEADGAMAATMLEKRFVPLEQTAPKFEVVRIRVFARAAELAREIPRAGARAGEASAAPYGYELRVESSDGLIAGRIDRALSTPAGPILQDYKSGAIFSLRQGDEPPEVKPEYAIQLQIYAALYQEATGTWPTKLQLIPLNGSPYDIPFSPAASLQLLAEARGVLAQLNDEIARCGDEEAAEWLLATPSPTACRYCTYRPACLPYLSRDVPNVDRQWPADVWGKFAGVRRLGNGRLMLTIRLAGDSLFFVRDITNPVAEEAMLDSLDEKATVGVFNSKRTLSPNAFEEGPLTSMHAGWHGG